MGNRSRLLFFAGSTRSASFNKKLARLGATIASSDGTDATFVDLIDYDMPLYNGDLEAELGPPENARRLKKLFEQHNGIMIACPEYNSSITPLLKNTLDWVSRVREEDGTVTVFKTRVFLLASASSGGMGGLRGLNGVRPVLELGLGALVLPDQFALPRAHTAFAEDGSLYDLDAQDRLRAAIRKLAHTASVLDAAGVFPN